MATPLIAKELQASFRLAIAEAKRMRHEYLTLEHLLLALLKDAKTRQVLSSCGANIPRLQKRLEQFLEETVERLPALQQELIELITTDEGVEENGRS